MPLESVSPHPQQGAMGLWANPSQFVGIQEELPGQVLGPLHLQGCGGIPGHMPMAPPLQGANAAARRLAGVAPHGPPYNLRVLLVDLLVIC